MLKNRSFQYLQARKRVKSCCTLRDGLGRVVKKTQQLAPFTGTTASPAGAVKSLSYGYAVSATGSGAGVGQLASLTYPNGTKVSYLVSALATTPLAPRLDLWWFERAQFLDRAIFQGSSAS